MTPIFVAMMWRSADGSLTIAFWYAVVLSTLMIAAGIWCLVAPESMRHHYFNLLNKRPRRGRLVAPSDVWGWKSSTQIRLGGLIAVAVAGAFITWVLFFTAPGVAY